MPSPLASYLLGTTFVGLGFLSFISPFHAHATLGISTPISLDNSSYASERAKSRAVDPTKINPAALPTMSTTQQSSPGLSAFCLAKGARDLALGILYIALEGQGGNDAAIGMLMAVTSLLSVFDGALAWSYGGGSTARAWGHWAGALAFASCAWWRLDGVY